MIFRMERFMVMRLRLTIQTRQLWPCGADGNRSGSLLFVQRMVSRWLRESILCL